MFAYRTVFLALLAGALIAPLPAAPTAAKTDATHKDPGTRIVRCSYQARTGSNVKEKVCKDIHSTGDEAARDAYRKLRYCSGPSCSGRNGYADYGPAR